MNPDYTYTDDGNGLTLKEELAEQGLRPAGSHESGWYYKFRNNGWKDSVWVTDKTEDAQ